MNAPARAAVVGDNRPALITADQLTRDFKNVIDAVEALELKSKDAPPVLEDDEDLASTTALIGDFGKYAKRIDQLRNAEKRPHLEAGNVIQAFFKGLEQRLLATKKTLEQRGTAYLNKKAEAERKVRLEAEAKAREAAAQKEREAVAAVQAGKAAEAVAAQAAAETLHQRADHAADAAAAKPAELAQTRTEGGTATLQQTWEFEIEDINRIDLEALRPFIPQTAIEQAMRAFVRSGRREIHGARIFAKTAGRFRT